MSANWKVPIDTEAFQLFNYVSCAIKYSKTGGKESSISCLLPPATMCKIANFGRKMGGKNFRKVIGLLAPKD